MIENWSVLLFSVIIGTVVISQLFMQQWSKQDFVRFEFELCVWFDNDVDWSWSLVWEENTIRKFEFHVTLIFFHVGRTIKINTICKVISSFNFQMNRCNYSYFDEFVIIYWMTLIKYYNNIIVIQLSLIISNILSTNVITNIKESVIWEVSDKIIISSEVSKYKKKLIEVFEYAKDI